MSPLLIKFGGQYWYRGNKSKQWIHHRSFCNGQLKQITEGEAEKIIKKEHHPRWIIDE
jgi:hypothetical protein